MSNHDRWLEAPYDKACAEEEVYQAWYEDHYKRLREDFEKQLAEDESFDEEAFQEWAYSSFEQETR